MAGKNTVEILLSAKDEASKALKEAFGTIDESNNRFLGGLLSMKTLVAGAFGALSGYLAKTGIDYDAMMEQSQVAWTTLLGSQDKAKQQLQDIANFAKATPFETSQVDAMAKYMFNAGYAGKQLFDQLMNISDVASAFNIPADAAKELTRQMSQVVQAGTAYTQDLNILQDQGVPIYKAIAKELGVNVDQVRQLASQGKITSDVYMKAFNDISKTVKGASDAQSQTFSGMISTMKDDFGIIAGQLSKPLFNEMKKGMDLLLPSLDAFSALAKGDFGTFSQTLEKTFGKEAGGAIVSFTQGIQSALTTVKNGITGIVDLAKGDSKGESILESIGFSPDAIQTVETIFSNIAGIIKRYMDMAQLEFQVVKGVIIGAWGAITNLFSGNNNIGASIGKIFTTAKGIIVPILDEIVSFVKVQLAGIKKFWDENGAGIIEGVKNFVAILAAIFKFLAPVILGILKMLWDNVAGVIDGAIKVIEGILLVFSGLFTGNWAKLWEGIKDIFAGGIEAAWNLINLLMFGRILGGIKAFIVDGAKFFGDFFNGAVDIFKNLDSSLMNVVKSMIDGVLGFFQRMTDGGNLIFGTLKYYGESTFSALWGTIKAVATNIYESVIGNFQNLYNGATGIFNSVLNVARNIFGAVKDAIANPVQTAMSLVGDAIDGIKGLFQGIANIHIPLPHLIFQGGSINPMDWGDASKRPSFGVNWYDKGGIFYGPSVIGVGEKRPEFVGALDDLRKIVREETGGGGPKYNLKVINNQTMDEQSLIRMLQRLEALN